MLAFEPQLEQPVRLLVFTRGVRQLALDAHLIMRRRDSPLDEVISLHRRAWHLIREAPVPESSEVYR